MNYFYWNKNNLKNQRQSAQICVPFYNSNAFTFNNLDLIETETITNATTITSFTEGLITYDYNNLNQLLSSTNPDKLFTYDDDGNMTQGFTPAGYVLTMTYDAANRLTTAEYTDSSSVLHRTEYSYSGDNLLSEMRKYEDGLLVTDISFIRAGFLPLQERDASNNVIKEYTWGLDYGGGIGGLLNLNQGGLDYSYLYDGKGNVSALLDPSQNVVASYRYDVFGVLMTKTGTFDQPYQFSTKRYDEETGLSYYGFRFYSPSIGRWITRDPIGEAGGINLYGFVGNSPVNWIDPYGEFLVAIPVIIKVTAAVIGVGVSAYAIWSYYDSPEYQNVLEKKAACEKENLTIEEEIKTYEEYIDSLGPALNKGKMTVDLLNATKSWEKTIGPSPKSPSPKKP